MAANWELQLISAIVRSPSPKSAFVEALDSGLEASTFQTSEAKHIWSRMVYYYNRPDKFGKVPGVELITEWFPATDLPSPSEDVEDLIDLVWRGHIQRSTDAAIAKFLATSADPTTDIIATTAALASELTQLQERTLGRKDYSFKEVGVSQTIDELSTIASNDGLTGMPYPWDPLNKMTGGINRGDYIMIYALPKSMKTWIGLYIAVYLAMTGRKVLIYSKEMTWEKTRARIACILTKTDYSIYKACGFSQEQEEDLVAALLTFTESEDTGDIIFTDATRPDGQPGGPAEIRRKMDIYKPDIVLLDSAYMLELPDQRINPYDWKSLAIVNRQLKQIFKTTGTPGIAIFQENERAAFKYKGTRGTASMAMNTSAINDCDLAIRGVYHKAKRMISLHLPAARETEQEGFTINAVAATDFSFATMELWDIGEFDDEDDDDDGDGAPPSSKRTRDAESRVSSFVGSQISDWKQ